MKNLLDRLNSKMNTTEERIIELKQRTIEIIQPEQQSEIDQKNLTEQHICGIMIKDLIFVALDCWKAKRKGVCKGELKKFPRNNG